MEYQIEESESRNGHRYLMTALLLLGLGLLLMVLATQNSTANVYLWPAGHTVPNGATENYNGDTINCGNQLWIQQGGTMNMNSTTLNMIPFATIRVEGTLKIGDSDNDNTTTADQSIVQPSGGVQNYFWQVSSPGVLVIENSLIRDYLDLELYQTNNVISHNTISGTIIGVYMGQNSQANINNNTFTNNQYALMAPQGGGKIIFTGNWVKNSQTNPTIQITDTDTYFQDNIIENNPAPQFGYRGANVVLDMNNDTIRNPSTSNLNAYIMSNGAAMNLYIDDCNFSMADANGVTIEGFAGQRITGNINDTVIYDNNGYGLGILYSDLTIDGLYSTFNHDDNLQVTNSNLNISNSKFLSGNGEGIQFNGPDQSTYTLRLSKVEISGNSGIGLLTQNYLGLQVDNSTIKNNNGHGIYINNANYANIHYSKVTGSFSNRGITAVGTNYLNITNNDISNNSAVAIFINGIGKARIISNTIWGKGNNNVESQASSVVLSKNTIQNGSRGFYAYNNNGNHNFDINQNIITKHSSNAIYIDNGHATITKNTIKKSTTTQIYVINLQSNSKIDDNDVRNGNTLGIEIQNSWVVSISGNTIINHTNEHAIAIHNLYCELKFVKNYIDKSKYGMDYFDNSNNNFGITFNNNTISNTSIDWAVYSDFYSYNGNASFQDNKLFDNPRGMRFVHYGSLKSMWIRRNSLHNTTTDWALYWENNGYKAGNLEIIKNNMDTLAHGIWVNNVQKVDIKNNVATNGFGQGIYVQEADGPLNITENKMTGNCQWGSYNLIYAYSNNNLHRDANVQRNNLSGNHQGYAVDFWGYGKILFEDNILNNNGDGADFDGVSLISRNNQANNNSYYGIEAYYFETTVHIYNETMNGNSYAGYYLEEIYGAKVLIDNCTFIGNNYEGLEVDYVYIGTTVNIENCVMDGGEYPVYFYWNVGTIKFHDNFVANATYDGIEIDNTEQGGMTYIYDNHFFMNNEHLYISDSNVIIENNLFERGRYGVYAYSYWETPLFIFRNNTMKGVGDYNIDFEYYNYKSGSGIYDNQFLNFGLGLQFYDNAGKDLPIFNNLFSMGRHGIYIDSIAPNVHDNTFKMVSTGIESYNSKAILRANTFTNCWDYCIASWEDKGIQIIDSSFSYSSIGVYSEGSLITIEGSTFSMNTYGAKINTSFGSVSGNKFTENKYGLYIESFSFVTVKDGEYSHNSEFGIWSESNTYTTMDVDGAATVTGNGVILNGDVTVHASGVLTITGSKFQLRSIGSSGYSVLIEPGGKLVASKTTFEPVSSDRPFGIEARSGTTLSLNDCDLNYLGSGVGSRMALRVATSNTVLEKVRIKNAADIALYVEGQVSIAMRNGTISNAKGYDVYIYNASTLRMGNTDFNKKNVMVLDTSKIIIERIISVEALDDSDLPYEGVSVTVTDESNAAILGTTDADGQWSEFFEGAIISSTGITDTKLSYKLSVTDGTLTFNDTVVLSDDFLKTYRFGIAPIVLTGPDGIVMDEDTVYDLEMTKYFFDNDALTYSVKGNVSTTYTFEGKVAHLRPVKDWYGHEDVTLVATDTHGLKAQYKISITVRPVNDAPIISGVPNLVLKEDQQFILDLLPFIYDPDTPQSGLTVTVSTSHATVDRTTVTFNYPTPLIEYVRISVKDSEGGSAQDVLVRVTEVNDPPQIKNVPVQEADEDVETTIDFAQWLSDEDNNVSSLVMGSSSPFVTGSNGTKLTFLFPDGPTQRFVTVMVSDGLANSTYLVEFFVSPVNDGPVLQDLPVVLVTEGEDYVFDLSPYVSDIDTNLSKLVVTTDSNNIKVEGLSLIINIPESGSMLVVKVTISDGFLSATKDLRIIIKPVNDPPVLTNPQGPKSGTVGANYKFQVTFKDPDAVNPAVFVVIDGKRYVMTKGPGDFKTGVVYEINLKNIIKSGDHSYHFEADDGSGEPNGVARTDEKFGLDVSAQQNYWWIIVIIIVIVIVAVLLLIGRGKKSPETVQMDDEPEAKDAEDNDEEKNEEETEAEPEEAEEVQEVDEVEEAPRKIKKVSGR
jgi:hypothetical protein